MFNACAKSIGIYRPLFLQVDSQEAAQKLGQAWCLLGMLRLKLLAPVDAVDPASKPHLEREGLLHEADAWLSMEKQACSPLLNPDVWKEPAFQTVLQRQVTPWFSRLCLASSQSERRVKPVQRLRSSVLKDFDSAFVQEGNLKTSGLQVREEMQLLPGGPDESPKIQQLSAQIADAQARSAALESKIVLRPAKSQYHRLREEVNSFLQRSCDITRVSDILAGLKVKPVMLAMCNSKVSCPLKLHVG